MYLREDENHQNAQNLQQHENDNLLNLDSERNFLTPYLSQRKLIRDQERSCCERRQEHAVVHREEWRQFKLLRWYEVILSQLVFIKREAGKKHKRETQEKDER